MNTVSYVVKYTTVEKFQHVAFSIDEQDNVLELSAEMFLDKNEIVQDLITSRMDNLDEFKNQNYDDLIMLHHSFGRWIRNTYGLWSEINPHIKTLKTHPDDYSFEIIQLLHQTLNTSKTL